MDLIAWRTIGKNPCDDPPVKITIAPRDPGTDVWPWIIPLARAVEMFGQEVVDRVGEEPVEVTLTIAVTANTQPTPAPSESRRTRGT